MRRVTRDAVRMWLRIGLMVRRAHDRRGLAIMSEHAVDDVVEDMLMRIMGREEGEAVILEPSLHGPAHAPWRGKWGEDEPHPFPDVLKAQH